MQFSNEQFYENQLLADTKVKHWTITAQTTPLEFVDTAGCGYEESPNRDSGSTANPEEAKLLFRHLEGLLIEIEKTVLADNKPISIGVISPYKAQVHLLKQELANLNTKKLSTLLSIEVNTVDSFQGQERDIIYISLVRSNANGEIGFLKDTRRTNVAMTRARKKLVIIGDGATLASNPFYNKLIGYAEQKNSYYSAWAWVA